MPATINTNETGKKNIGIKNHRVRNINDMPLKGKLTDKIVRPHTQQGKWHPHKK
jgi:hypothetical protein